MEAKGELIADAAGIRFRGTDAEGRPFDVALDAGMARRLIFKLHAMVLEHLRMRARVTQSDGGRAA